MIEDHDGEELFPVHVLPYRVRSREYGDYAYTKTHDSGELTASTLLELAQKLQELAVKHVAGWAVPEDSSCNVWIAETYTIPALDRFKFGRDGNGCHTDFAGKVAVAPSEGMTYLSLGQYRIELRHERGSTPELPCEDFGFEKIVPAMEDALKTAREASRANVEKMKEASRLRVEADKRAQLTRLKAELGEN